MRLKQQFLVVAAAYVAADGRSESRISTLMFGNGQRLRSLRQGSGMLSDNLEDALQWLSDRWPEGLAWPVEVSRPTPTPPPDGASPAAEASA